MTRNWTMTCLAGLLALAAFGPTARAEDAMKTDVVKASAVAKTPADAAKNPAKPHGCLLFKDKDFGPAEVAKPLIGPATSHPEYPAGVVVYLNMDLKKVQSMFVSVPEKGQDIRHVSYEAAVAFLDDAIKTAKGDTLATLLQTRSRLRKGVEQLEASHAFQPTSAPADNTPPAARKILDALEAAGKEFSTLTADVVYTVENRLTGDKEVRTGDVAFQQKTDETPAKFRVTFETMQLPPGPSTKNQVDHIFDGMWYTSVKHKLKHIDRFQVAAEGQQIDPLAIGKGPFPVPFGQKADDVIAIAEASTRELRKGEPEGTDYLRLVPRASKKNTVNFTSLEMWIDAKTHLPTKIVARDASKNKTTVEFSKIQTEAKLNPALFVFEKPAGWTVNVESLRK